MKPNNDVIIRREVTDFSVEDGCQLADPFWLFVGIYSLTKGQPCVDCSYKPCDLLNKFKYADKHRDKDNDSTITPMLKTNAELASKFGISKRQVAKRRIPGTNFLKED